MEKNGYYIQYVQKDKRADELFALSRTRELNSKDGVKINNRGEHDSSLKEQADALGLTQCEKFEGYTLSLDCGYLQITDAEPIEVIPGTVSLWGRVIFN